MGDTREIWTASREAQLREEVLKMHKFASDAHAESREDRNARYWRGQVIAFSRVLDLLNPR